MAAPIEPGFKIVMSYERADPTPADESA